MLQVRQMSAQKLSNFRCGWKSLGAILGVQSGNDGCEPVWNLCIDFAYWGRRFLADSLEDRHRAAGTERRLAGAHRVQYAPQAEKVAAVVYRLAFGLFWGH